eukprot:2487134-Prymnesium_polylepis.1
MTTSGPAHFGFETRPRERRKSTVATAANLSMPGGLAEEKVLKLPSLIAPEELEEYQPEMVTAIDAFEGEHRR